MNKPNTQFGNIKKLNLKELKAIVKNLNNKKSSVDGINTKMLNWFSKVLDIGSYKNK